MGIKLGFYTYSYIDRLGMEIEPVFETIAATGYQGVDISATWRDDVDPALMPAGERQRYVRAAEKFHLEIAAVVTHVGLCQAIRHDLPLNLKGAVDVARSVGARQVAFHLGMMDGPPAETGNAWQQSIAYLKDACEYASRFNLTIMLDGLWCNFLVHTPELVVRFIDAVGAANFRHNFDPCYLELCSFELETAAPLLAPYSVHAHVKDYLGHYPEFRHMIPGEGRMDHGRWIRPLTAMGFDGYLVNECFTDAPLERACTVGYRTLKLALADV